jgi:ribonuclease HII
VYVDGNHCPDLKCPSEAVVKGDSKIAEISAASILAKVDRDREMALLDREYPQYGFAKHKGYPTAAHFAALTEHGPLPEHRRSFKPVRELLETK